MKKASMMERLFALALGAAVSMYGSPALAGSGGGAGGGIQAGMQKATQLLTDASSGLIAMGVVVVTIAILFVGFRMIFRNAQWADLAPVFWGGLLVGGASSLAGALMA